MTAEGMQLALPLTSGVLSGFRMLSPKSEHPLKPCAKALTREPATPLKLKRAFCPGLVIVTGMGALFGVIAPLTSRTGVSDSVPV